MSKRAQPIDDSFVVDRPSGYLHWQGTASGGKYIDAAVRTEFGFVQVYADLDVLRLSFIKDRRCYSRQWRRGFQPRYIVTLAHQFAQELSA